MNTTLEAQHKAILEFLMQDHPEIQHIAPDQDLIDSRILDSLRFMNFIFLLEELTGEQFEVDRISVDDFRSIARIESRFLKGERHAA
jgi:acyl carrier protein